MLVLVAQTILNWNGQGKIRFFCGDETRLGLKTLGGRRITANGIKPIGSVQWQFEATYFYGVVEPQTGESFFYEFTHLNTDCFQVFLNLVSQQFQDDILIIQLDNGAFHKAKRLIVPHNIIKMFQPPHCQATFWGEDSPQKLAPELNPIEQVWQYLKRQLRWTLPRDLEQLRQLLTQNLECLTKEMIASITGRQSILDALSVARI